MSRPNDHVVEFRDSQSRSSQGTYIEEDSTFRSKWEKTNIFGRLHFTHIIPFFKMVHRSKGHKVTLNDLPRLGKTERVEAFDDKLMRNYERQQFTRPGLPKSMPRAIMRTFVKEIIWQFIFQFGFFGLRLVYGFFLHELLETLDDPTNSVGECFRSAIGLFVCMVVSMYSSQQAYFNNYNLVTKSKAAIISVIYKKITRTSLYSLNQISMGKIVNIVANDINSFDKFFNLFALCLMPIVFGGGIAIMCVFYGAACLTGFAFILLTFPIQFKLAKSSSPIRKEKNLITDKRVKLTDEILDTIRLLKMYTWEMAFKGRIEEVREKEVQLLQKLAYREGGQRVLAFSAISGSSFIIFLTYSLTGGTITVPLVFSTIFIMQVVAMYGVFIPAMGIAFLIEARLTFRRIEQILNLPEVKTHKYKRPASIENAIEFKSFSGFWDLPQDPTKKKTSVIVDPKAALDALSLKPNKSLEEAKEVFKHVRAVSAGSMDLEDQPQREVLEEKANFDLKDPNGKQNLIKDKKINVEEAVLKDLNLDIKAQTLTAIIGRVGSGKSTLLLSLTGEMPRLEGVLRVSGKIAYVEQEPIIFSGTIRENILFGLDFDDEFYARVVRASNLINDFKSFALKDLTEIGEKGITLSGGQKARVALARALYSRADIYLLDDPLSAVDTKVAKQLYENAIRTFLRDKTVLLATHQVHFVRDAEKIVVMDEGRIVASGTYDELLAQGVQLEAMTDEVADNQPKFEEEEDRQGQLQEDNYEDRQGAENIANEETGKLFGDEDTNSGKVTWKIYKQYVKLCLTPVTGAILLILLVGTEGLNIAYGRVVGLWGQGDIERNTALGVAGGLAIANYCFFFTKNVVYNRATLRGSRKLHDNMLDVVLKNQVQFFDTNPLGRILSRFSHDVGIMDKILPQYLLDILEGNMYLFALFIVVWVINPWVVISGVATIIVFVLIIKFTTPTVVVARQLELVSRSPIYSFFSLTLSGLIAVRSFGQAETFNKRFTTMVNAFAKANYTFWHSSRLMSMLIDYSSTIGCIIGLSIYIATKNSVTQSLIGQGALYLLLLNEQIQWILRQTINVNLFMASAARILDYTYNNMREAPLTLPSDEEFLKSGWPQHGEIEFQNVFMKYRPTTDHVVKGLSFKVTPGEKIGCVGRTGAGKSSILQILFRMVEIDRSIEAETSLKIDNKDIGELGLHALRKNISIIPQAPVIFSGTIKRNLDPFGTKTDEELWQVLEEVNLKHYIERMEKKLETDMSNANQVFSVGQKQLVCLARAILKKSKIIVLDEATANVDFETDVFIQHTIMEKFKDCTVFTIAHRLSTIANYDRILVMSQGKLVEFDAPYRLLVENQGDNNITNHQGIFASMVKNTGQKASRHIFETAKNKFYGVIHPTDPVIALDQTRPIQIRQHLQAAGGDILNLDVSGGSFNSSRVR